MESSTSSTLRPEADQQKPNISQNNQQEILDRRARMQNIAEAAFDNNSHIAITKNIEKLKTLDRTTLVKNIAEATSKNPEHVADVFLCLIDTINKTSNERENSQVCNRILENKYVQFYQKFYKSTEDHGKTVEELRTLKHEHDDLIDLNAHLLTKLPDGNYQAPLYPTHDRVRNDESDEEDYEEEVEEEVEKEDGHTVALAPSQVSAVSSPLSSIKSKTPRIPSTADPNIAKPSLKRSRSQSNTSDSSSIQFNNTEPTFKRARRLSIASDTSSVQLDSNLVAIAKSISAATSTSAITSSPKNKSKDMNSASTSEPKVNSKTKPSAPQAKSKSKSKAKARIYIEDQDEDTELKSLQLRKNKKHPNVHHCTLTVDELKSMRPTPSDKEMKRFDAVRAGTLPRFVIDDAEYIVLMRFRAKMGGQGRWRGKSELKEGYEGEMEEFVDDGKGKSELEKEMRKGKGKVAATEEAPVAKKPRETKK